MRYVYDFDPDEPNQTSGALYRLAVDGGARVLDLGCGPGIVGSRLAASGKQVTGVDLDREALDVAEQHGIRVVHADLQSPDALRGIAGEQFDTIVLADVLEHMVRPDRLLDLVLRGDHLAAGGQLLVSFPNVTHGSVLAELMSGQFEYRDSGVMDRTHLRWFTESSMTGLLARCGLRTTEVLRTIRPIDHLARPETEAARARLAQVPDLVPDIDTYQYVMRVRREDGLRPIRTAPSPDHVLGAEAAAARAGDLVTGEADEASPVAELERYRRLLAEEQQAAIDELERAADEMRRLRRDVAVARKDADERGAELSGLRSQVRELSIAAKDSERSAQDRATEQGRSVAVEVVRLRTRLRRTTKERDSLRAQLESTRASESFRLGAALTAPARSVRRTLSGRRRRTS